MGKLGYLCRIMFRPNLQNEHHRRAWALLQSVPEGQKSAFLVKAILDSARQDALESTLRLSLIHISYPAE